MNVICNAGFCTRLLVLASALFVCSRFAAAHDPLADEPGHTHDAAVQGRAGAGPLDPDAVRSLLLAFRESGDDRFLDDAWQAIEPAFDETPDDAALLVTAAFVAQSRHQFDVALEFVGRALAIDSNNDEAWLLRASILLVLGDTAAAGAACARLRRSPPLVLLTCNARSSATESGAEQASQRLVAILNMPDARRMPFELLAWSYSVAADLAAASGQHGDAIDLYQRSLDYAERTQVRAALIDVRLDNAGYADSDTLKLLNEGSDALPLLIRRMIVLKRLQKLDTMQATVDGVHAEFLRWIDSEDWLHAREMARFFIDVVEQPKLARRLSLINLDLQKEPEDLRLEQRTRNLAEAAYDVLAAAGQG